jgi:hypothetical protein
MIPCLILMIYASLNVFLMILMYVTTHLLHPKYFPRNLSLRKNRLCFQCCDDLKMTLSLFGPAGCSE